MLNILLHKNGYNKQLLILFMVSVFFIGCRNDDIIDDDAKFAAVYVDLIIVNEQHKGNAELVKTKSDSIYQAHGVTEHQYKSTIEYYQENPERWRQFFSKAETYLRDKRKELEKKK